MSDSFEVRSSIGSYSVSIAPGLLDALLQENRDALFLIDQFFLPRFKSAGFQFVAIEAHERSKSLEAIPDLVVKLKEMGANRESKFIALGGGIVQDAATFVTSVYMRGVPWAYIPTTALAMVDSCIGGKSSINVGNFKNLLGTFHPPVFISIDPNLVSSLNCEQRVAGLIEAAKICYCRGSQAFAEYLTLAPSAAMAVASIEQLICLSLTAKKWFIEIDEFDRKERLLLNFGHTFGHAIEGASHFRIAHGIAVGLGMLCAIEMGRLSGISYPEDGRVSKLEAFLHQILADVPNLQDETSTLSIPVVLNCFQADKKHGKDRFKVILPAPSGDVELISLSREEGTLRLLESAINIALRGAGA